MAQKVTADKIEAAIAKALQQYGDDVESNLNAITATVARGGVNSLRQSSAAKVNGKEYAKGWKLSIQKHRLGDTAVIYNRRPGLPHLLEHGHAKRNGGRTRAIEHIKPVEDELIEKYQKEVVAKL